MSTMDLDDAPHDGVPGMMNPDEIIVLDVGGHKFKTTRATLCKEPNSALEANVLWPSRQCRSTKLRWSILH